jgi:transposase
MAILDAILAGEHDPRKLASLADHRVKKSRAQIEVALTGDYRPELLFVLSQALQNYRQIQQQIARAAISVLAPVECSWLLGSLACEITAAWIALARRA